MSFRIILTMTIMFSLLSAHVAMSQTSPADEQRNRDRAQQIEEGIRRSITPPTETVVPKQNIVENLKKSDDCYALKNIIIKETTLLKKRDLISLEKKYTGYCIDNTLVNDLIIELNNLYIAQKAITSRVYLALEQDVSGGTVTFMAVEGTVEDFVMMENGEIKEGVKPDFTTGSAFPFQRGKILRLDDIESGLDVMNSLPSQAAQMEIVPGDEDGSSKVLILNTPSDANMLRFGYSNAGSESTGEHKANLGYSRYGLFGLNDIFSATFYSDMEADAPSVFDRTLSLSYSFHIGKLFVSQSLSRTHSRVSNYLMDGTRMKNDTYSVNSYTTAEYNLYRSSIGKLTLGTNLTVMDDDNYIIIDDIKTRIDVNSRQLTTFSGYLTYDRYGANYMLYIKPSYVRGVDWFGSLNDRDYEYSPEAQFDMGKLTLYYMYRHGPLVITIFGDSQYTDKEMYSQNSFSVGGEYSVRGYKGNSLQGTKGWFLQNEITVPFNNITDMVFMRNLSVTAFFDCGMALGYYDTTESYLSGGGLKLAFNHKYVDASFTYAKPMYHPEDFEADSSAMYVSLNFKIPF